MAATKDKLDTRLTGRISLSDSRGHDRRTRAPSTSGMMAAAKKAKTVAVAVSPPGWRGSGANATASGVATSATSVSTKSISAAWARCPSIRVKNCSALSPPGAKANKKMATWASTGMGKMMIRAIASSGVSTRLAMRARTTSRRSRTTSRASFQLTDRPI